MISSEPFASQDVSTVSLPPRPFVVGIGGATSEVGKTTLLCDLLRVFPGWEAIKTTRGHYRSCGKDPHACCVSNLLEDHAIVKSGRELTYLPGKDTGRYWDAGATNVHWVIATDAEVANGTRTALSRVKATGVFVEGNSFTEEINPDFFIMVVRIADLRIKRTAKRALGKVSAIYLSDEEGAEARQMKELSPQWMLTYGNLNVPVVNHPHEIATFLRELRIAAPGNRKT